MPSSQNNQVVPVVLPPIQTTPPPIQNSVQPDTTGQQAIVQKASNTSSVAQAVGGTMMNAANTPVGGSAMLVGSNLAMAQVGQQTGIGAEIPALGALVTFIFQFIKQHPKFNQDKFWHITIIIIAVIIGFVVWRDIVKAIEAAGLIAFQAISNYQSWKLTGWGGLTPYTEKEKTV